MKDEARRIAFNVASLPDLLERPCATNHRVHQVRNDRSQCAAEPGGAKPVVDAITADNPYSRKLHPSADGSLRNRTRLA
jgi:hypothetical protein